MKVTLTTRQKQQLKIQHSMTSDCRIRDRIKAILLANDGWSAEVIAHALLIHETTVRQHLKDYLDSRKLKPENGGSQSYLSPIQTQELIQHLAENAYHCTKQIITYVLKKYCIGYTIPGINKWLHHNGFTYKKRKGIPHKFSEAKQDEFISAYKALKASCSKDEPIIFIDAVHPTQATKISYGWIRKGQNKVIETTGSRTRLNIIGGLNLTDIATTVVKDYKTINGESVADFFHKLREHYPSESKLHVILDGAGYHRRERVIDTAKELGIELHYLPPYSPNLNSIERLWKVMNEKARNNIYFKSTRDFKDAIFRFFTVTLPEISDSLISRINDNFQVIKRASPR